MNIINPDFVPSTIEDAVNHLFGNLTEEHKEQILEIDNSAQIHHTIGRFLRNSWSLWEKDTPLKNDAIQTYEIAHADDISGLILGWLFAKVRNKDFDPILYCESFHKHWAQFGITSIEAGQ